MAITETQIQETLKTLLDPNTGKDFISSKCVKNVQVSGNDITLDVVLGYPSKSVQAEVQQLVTDKLKSLPDAGNVTVNVGSRIVPHSVQRGVQLLPNVKNHFGDFAGGLADQGTGNGRTDGDLAGLDVGLVVTDDLVDIGAAVIEILDFHRCAEHAAAFRIQSQRVDDLRIGELGFDLGNAPLYKALTFLRRFVFGVLGKIALRSRFGNRLNDLRTIDTAQTL